MPWSWALPRRCRLTRWRWAAGWQSDRSTRRRGRVEATEIAEKIHGEEHEVHSAAADANFRKFTGIYLGIVAMLLAITALGGSNATKTMLNSNIQASDIYGYYQAKNIRQTAYQLTAEQLESELLALPDIPEAAEPRSKTESNAIARGSIATRATRRPERARKNCSPRQRSSRPGVTKPPSGTRISTSPRHCSRSRSCSGRSASSPPRARSSI